MMSLPIIHSWVFAGYGPDVRLPNWVVFLNYACNEERMIIHKFDGVIVAFAGDTIQVNSVRDVSVVRAPENEGKSYDYEAQLGRNYR